MPDALMLAVPSKLCLGFLRVEVACRRVVRTPLVVYLDVGALFDIHDARRNDIFFAVSVGRGDVVEAVAGPSNVVRTSDGTGPRLALGRCSSVAAEVA